MWTTLDLWNIIFSIHGSIHRSDILMFCHVSYYHNITYLNWFISSCSLEDGSIQASSSLSRAFLDLPELNRDHTWGRRLPFPDYSGFPWSLHTEASPSYGNSLRSPTEHGMSFDRFDQSSLKTVKERGKQMPHLAQRNWRQHTHWNLNLSTLNDESAWRRRRGFGF